MRDSRLLLIACSTLVLALLPATGASASDQATASVVVTAQMQTRTSLRVSSRLLHFEVATPSAPATAVIDFSAGARTGAGGEVVLSVEAVRAVHGPGGAADVETSLSFSGEGDGTQAGALESSAPTVAGRWVGSGLRKGRLIFALWAGAPGVYTVPVRIVLSTP